MTDPFSGLPRNHFGAILADPPWGFEVWSGPEKKVASRGTVAPYQTMEMDDIAALPVADLLAGDAVLFMWVVWPTLPEALKIIDAWGFKYKTCGFCWLKADPYRLWGLEEDIRMGLGYWTRSNSEVCLLATKGKPKRRDNSVRQGIIASIQQHSRKPDGIHERIERLVAGPYLELFARQSTRPGWTFWGNETTKFGGKDEDGYDARKNSAGCYEVAIEALRQRREGGEG